MSTNVRTSGGLRRALNGVPDAMRVRYGRDVRLPAATVGELRTLAMLPCAVQVTVLPYEVKIAMARKATRQMGK